MVCNNIKACDIDSRADLLKNIILTGGSSNINGLGERLKKGVQSSIAAEQKVGFVKRCEGWDHWIEGSVVASLTTFKNMKITKAEYEENGVNNVHKKWKLFP